MSDFPTLAWFEQARLQLPYEQQEVAVLVDADVLRWFKSQGSDWQARMRAALRLYASAHQSATTLAR